MDPACEFYREYRTEDGETLTYTPEPDEVDLGLASALAGRRLGSVVPRCTCGWRGEAIDRSLVDPSSEDPGRSPFAQWFLRHMVG